MGTELITINEKYEDLKRRIEQFQSFEDSLAGNQRFRKQLLDSVSSADELNSLRENQRIKLSRQTTKFEGMSTNRENLIMKYKFYEGAGKVMDIIFVCMALVIIIDVFGRKK